MASSAAAAFKSSPVSQIQESAETAKAAKSARKRKQPEEKSGETSKADDLPVFSFISCYLLNYSN